MHRDNIRIEYGAAEKRKRPDRPEHSIQSRGDQPRPSGIDPVWRRRVGEPVRSEDTPTWRLFVAIPVPQPAVDEIGTFINDMPTMAGNNVRWTPRENVHLTLLFLGDTATDLVERVQEQITAAAGKTSPFTLRLGEAGAFPSYQSPKILWVGLQGEVRKLVQLQGRVEGAMRSIGFEPERRPFKPHITVGRTVRDLEYQYAGDVGFSWRRSVIPSTRAEVPMTGIHLLRSQLQPGGAVYESVFTAPLGE